MSEQDRRHRIERIQRIQPLPHRPTKAGLASAMAFCLVIGGFCGAAYERSRTPAPARAASAPSSGRVMRTAEAVPAKAKPARTDQPTSFEFRRESGDSTLFVIPVRGAVGRDTVRFAVDTGAEITIVREQDAAAMGAMPTDLHDREIVVIGSVMPLKGATIPSMRIAGVDLGETEVLIGPDTLPFSLLGQKEMSRLGAIEFDGDVMTIRPSRSEESLD